MADFGETKPMAQRKITHPNVVLDAKARRIVDRLKKFYKLGQKACATTAWRREGQRQRYGNQDQTKMMLHEAAATLKVRVPTLVLARKFADAYSEKEFNRLCTSRNKDTRMPLNVGHVIQLLYLEKKDRKEWQDRAIENGWTASQLSAALGEQRGDESVESHKKPLKRLKTIDDVFRQLLADTRTWNRRCEEVWFGQATAVEVDEGGQSMATLHDFVYKSEFEPRVQKAAELLEATAKLAGQKAKALRRLLATR